MPSSTILPAPGFHRHVPSLMAHCAMAARPLLQPDMHRDLERKQSCVNNRGRLSHQLLDWCDDLHMDIAEDSAKYCIHSTDALWLLPHVSTAFRPVKRIVEYEVCVHMFHHLDWVRPNVGHVQRLRVLLCNATRLLHRWPWYSGTFCMLMESVYTRMIFSVGHSSDHVRALTLSLLKRHPRYKLRTTMAMCDPNFVEHFALFEDSVPPTNLSHSRYCRVSNSTFDDVITMCTDPISQNVPAIFCLALVMLSVEQVKTLLSVIDISRWSDDDRYDVVRSALKAGQADVLRKFLVMAPLTSAEERNRVWHITWTIECADVCIERLYAFDGCVHFCTNGAVISHLLKRGVSPIPLNPNLSLLAWYDCVMVIGALSESWKAPDECLLNYLCRAICNCTDADVLRVLVRMVDHLFGGEPRPETAQKALNDAYMNCSLSHDRFLRMCVRLKADVDVRDEVYGENLLFRAIRERRNGLVDYLRNIGCCTTARDFKGKRALDYVIDNDRITDQEYDALYY